MAKFSQLLTHQKERLANESGQNRLSTLQVAPADLLRLVGYESHFVRSDLKGDFISDFFLEFLMFGVQTLDGLKSISV